MYLYSSTRLRRFTEEHARLNESNVENISSPNSPSSLERNYESFYDHERIDAVEAIESSRIEKKRDKWNEIGDKQVACFIFEVNSNILRVKKCLFPQVINFSRTTIKRSPRGRNKWPLNRALQLMCFVFLIQSCDITLDACFDHV